MNTDKKLISGDTHASIYLEKTPYSLFQLLHLLSFHWENIRIEVLCSYFHVPSHFLQLQIIIKKRFNLLFKTENHNFVQWMIANWDVQRNVINQLWFSDFNPR